MPQRHERAGFGEQQEEQPVDDGERLLEARFAPSALRRGRLGGPSALWRGWLAMSAPSTSLDATTTPSRSERQTPVACLSEAATRACNEWEWVIGEVSTTALALRHSAALVAG